MGVWHWAPDGMDPFDLALHVTEYQAILDSDFYFLPSAVSGTPQLFRYWVSCTDPLVFPSLFPYFPPLTFYSTLSSNPFVGFSFLSSFFFFFVLRCPLFLKKLYPVWFHGCNVFFDSEDINDTVKFWPAWSLWTFFSVLLSWTLFWVGGFPPVPGAA